MNKIIKFYINGFYKYYIALALLICCLFLFLDLYFFQGETIIKIYTYIMLAIYTYSPYHFFFIFFYSTYFFIQFCDLINFFTMFISLFFIIFNSIDFTTYFALTIFGAFYALYKIFIACFLFYFIGIPTFVIGVFYYGYKLWTIRDRIMIVKPFFLKYFYFIYLFYLYICYYFEYFIHFLGLFYGKAFIGVYFYIIFCNELFDLVLGGLEEYLDNAPTNLDWFVDFMLKDFFDNVVHTYHPLIRAFCIFFPQYLEHINVYIFVYYCVWCYENFYIALFFLVLFFYNLLVDLFYCTIICFLILIPMEYTLSKAFLYHIDDKSTLTGYEIILSILKDFYRPFFNDLKNLKFLEFSFYVKYFNLLKEYHNIQKNKKRRFFCMTEFLVFGYSCFTWGMIYCSAPICLFHLFFIFKLTSFFYLVILFFLQISSFFVINKIYSYIDINNLYDSTIFIYNYFFNKFKNLISYFRPKNYIRYYTIQQLSINIKKKDFSGIKNFPFSFGFFLSLTIEPFFKRSVKISFSIQVVQDYYFQANQPNTFIYQDITYVSEPFLEFREEFRQYIYNFHYNMYLKHEKLEMTIDNNYYFRKSIPSLYWDYSNYIFKMGLYFFTSDVILINASYRKERTFDNCLLQARKDYYSWLLSVRQTYPNFKEFYLNLRKHLIERKALSVNKVTVLSLIQRFLFYFLDCIEQKIHYEYFSVIYRLNRVLNEFLYLDGNSSVNNKQLTAVSKKVVVEDDLYTFLNNLNESNNRNEIFFHYVFDTEYSDEYIDFDYSKEVPKVPNTLKNFFINYFRTNSKKEILFCEFDYNKTNFFLRIWRRFYRVYKFISKLEDDYVADTINFGILEGILFTLGKFTPSNFYFFFSNIYFLFQEKDLKPRLVEDSIIEESVVYDLYHALNQISSTNPDIKYLVDSTYFKLRCIKNSTFLFPEFSSWDKRRIAYAKYENEQLFKKEQRKERIKKKFYLLKQKLKYIFSQKFVNKKLNAINLAFKQNQKQPLIMRANPTLIYDILNYYKEWKNTQYLNKLSEDIRKDFNIFYEDSGIFFLDKETQVNLKKIHDDFHERSFLYEYNLICWSKKKFFTLNFYSLITFIAY